MEQVSLSGCNLPILVKPQKNHCDVLFIDGHWLLEGSQATVKRQKPRSNQPPATPNTPRTTSQAESNLTEANHTKPSRTEPSQAKPGHSEPHHTTPSHATPSHATPKQATPKTNQAMRSRPSASPVAALLRRVVEVAGVRYRPEQDVIRLPWPFEVFFSFSVGCTVLAAAVAASCHRL